MVYLFNDALHAGNTAKDNVGNTEYEYFDSHSETRGRLEGILNVFGFGKSTKCNCFVYDMLSAGDVAPGRMIGGRIPSAMEWAEGAFNIKGYRVIENPNIFNLQVGDVLSDGFHVGIYYPLQNGSVGTISSSSANYDFGLIRHNDWGFRGGSNITVRRAY
jgi:hypothetical protein